MHKRTIIMLVIMALMVSALSGWLISRYYHEQFYVYAGAVPAQFDSAFLEPIPSVVPIAIIGSGCAGLSAAIYGARLHYHTVVFEGKHPGGQLTGTTWVENWPGMDKILGTDIILRLK